MKLRTRLAITVLATSIPVVVLLGVWRARFEWKNAEQGLVDFARERMLSGGREACEASPETFPPPPRPPRDVVGPLLDGAPRRPRNPPSRERDASDAGPRDFAGREPGSRASPDGGPPPEMRIQFWAYDKDFTSRNARAPVFPDELKTQLARGVDFASTSWELPNRTGIVVGVRMPWSEGPCAVILARRATIGPPGAVRDLVIGSTALGAILVAAVFLAAGSIVERVRRLTAQVRESAASRYTTRADVRGSDEVTELATAFNVAASEVQKNLAGLEAREKALREFIENTTHDVMLPLTVLQGHLTTLRRRVESSTPVEREVVLDALQEAHYMGSLIHNLAVVSRLESDPRALDRHPVDLNALVERTVARHAPIAHARGIQLDHGVPPTPLCVAGDVTLIEQAVSNLIHNAVRYVEPGGHVAVVLAGQGGNFSLRVLDDGPGIPSGLQARIFERSFRADDARSRHPGGHGLGLSIAKNVCERHGFTLELRTPETNGAEFEIRGPCTSA